MKNLEKFLDYLEEAEEMTADTEKVRDGNWVVNRNQSNTDYEGGDYQDPRIAIMYDGTQGHNGWYWEVIEGKNVVGTSNQVFKTADDAKEDAEMWIERLTQQADPEPDLGRIGESEKPEPGGPGWREYIKKQREKQKQQAMQKRKASIEKSIQQERERKKKQANWGTAFKATAGM